MVNHALAFHLLLFWEFPGSFLTLALEPAGSKCMFALSLLIFLHNWFCELTASVCRSSMLCSGWNQ